MMRVTKIDASIPRVHRQIEELKFCIRSLGLEFKEEFRFHPVREWRFDLAIPSLKIGIEYQGHGTTGKKKHVGGHASIIGMSNDCEKLNSAQALGWRVLKFTVFHFGERDRAKHKLRHPIHAIQEVVEEIRKLTQE